MKERKEEIMKNIILTSSFADVADVLKKPMMLNFKSSETVGIIPTASLVEDYTGYMDETRTWFKENAINTVELDLLNSSTTELQKQIESLDVLLVTGGNTFYLLQELKRTNVDNVIIEFINAGKLYIGESAGSVILSPNITYVESMDDRSVATSLTSDSGLSVVDFYTVPHYKSEPFIDTADKVIHQYTDLLPLKIISNNQCISIRGNEIKINTL